MDEPTRSEIERYLRGCLAPPTAETAECDYLEASELLFFLQDALQQLDPSPRRPIREQLSDYFGRVLSGVIVCGRPQSFVLGSFRNRVGFVGELRRRSEGLLSYPHLNALDVHQACCFICPDFSREISEHIELVLSLLPPVPSAPLTSVSPDELLSLFGVYALYYPLLRSLLSSIKSYVRLQRDTADSYLQFKISAKLYVSLVSSILKTMRHNEKPLFELNSLIIHDDCFLTILREFLFHPVNQQVVRVLFSSVSEGPSCVVSPPSGPPLPRQLFPISVGLAGADLESPSTVPESERAQAGGGCVPPTPAVKFRTPFLNVVYDAMQNRGWTSVNGNDWDLFWPNREWILTEFDRTKLKPHQKVSQYRNNRELCRKDLLINNVRRRRLALEKSGEKEEASHYDFMPLSYTLPIDTALFTDYARRNPKVHWIMKPVGQAQGRGIFLLTDLRELKSLPMSPTNSFLAQLYIENPLLVGQKKFDLRLYVLVTSYNPLTVFVHNSGFARFTNSRYDLNNLSDRSSHLTNVSIQSKTSEYDAETGGKWSVWRVRRFLNIRFGMARTNEAFEAVQALIIRALQAVQPVMQNNPHCFELYGFDVMLDEALRPWLIEINAAPSMETNTEEDYSMKFHLISDVMTVLDVECSEYPRSLFHLTVRHPPLHGFDLIFLGEPIKKDSRETIRCRIGTLRPTRESELPKYDFSAFTADPAEEEPVPSAPKFAPQGQKLPRIVRGAARR